LLVFPSVTHLLACDRIFDILTKPLACLETFSTNWRVALASSRHTCLKQDDSSKLIILQGLKFPNFGSKSNLSSINCMVELAEPVWLIFWIINQTCFLKPLQNFLYWMFNVIRSSICIIFFFFHFYAVCLSFMCSYYSLFLLLGLVRASPKL